MMLTNYYHKTDSKKCIQAILKGISMKTIYELQLFFNSFQTILINYYQRNHCKQSLQTIMKLWNKPFQTMPTNYYNRNHCKQCWQTFIGKWIQTSLTNYKRTPSKLLFQKSFKMMLKIIITKLIPKKAYKLF